MNISIFSDKKHRPTEKEIVEAIDSLLPVWQELIKHIHDNYHIQEDFKFLYGKRYGWALRFRINGKLLTSLYPTQNGFTVQVNLSAAAIEQVRQMNYGKNVQDAIAKAKPYTEGRWLFIPVESKNDITDIQHLIALRSETKGLKKRKDNN